MYGTFDIEPFEVRAKSKEEAIRKSLNHRFGDDKPKGDIARGRIEQCPITNKIAWISSDGENIVYLTGPMRIEVADSTAFKSKMSFPD